MLALESSMVHGFCSGFFQAQLSQSTLTVSTAAMDPDQTKPCDAARRAGAASPHQASFLFLLYYEPVLLTIITGVRD